MKTQHSLEPYFVSELQICNKGLFICRLKREYESTDEKTNLGFIVSPMCDKQQEAISVKIVVHSAYSVEPVTFTSDGKLYDQIERVKIILHDFLCVSSF